MRGPNLVSEADMAPTECTWWATCKDLALTGWTATDLCSWCVETVQLEPSGAARTTVSHAADRARPGTG